MGVTQLDTLEAFTQFGKAAGDKIIGVDFYADWCGPCKQISPAFEVLSNEMTDVAFCKVNVDVNKEVASFYQIKSMPTFIFLRSNTVLNRFSGADPNKLRSTLQNLRQTAFDVIPYGQMIKAFGLKATQYNGLTGKCLSYIPEKKRYTVQLEKNDTKIELALKRTNFVQILKVTRETDPSKSNTIADVNSSHEYVLDDGSTVSSDQVILPNDTTCELVGLSKAELNGKIGKILSYDKESGRYLVQMKMDLQLKIKRTNVRL
eukprot:m.55802 g.55802  ORF g.55802 m.55802 type:complete len:261 (+) comp22133_c0_seq2:228-1010(+)